VGDFSGTELAQTGDDAVTEALVFGWWVLLLERSGDHVPSSHAVLAWNGDWLNSPVAMNGKEEAPDEAYFQHMQAEPVRGCLSKGPSANSKASPGWLLAPQSRRGWCMR